jgi:hypothetical protein
MVGLWWVKLEFVTKLIPLLLKINKLAYSKTITLTVDDDTFSGTTGNDTFNATSSTLSADDRIIDGSTTDTDVMNIIATADTPTGMDVTYVERINIDWNSFSTPDVDLDNVAGATVSLTSSKAGYMGNANFTSVGSNNISTGTGVKGTLDVEGIEDASITSTLAKVIDVGGTTAADGEITINAGAATDITVVGGDDVTLTALLADDISLTTAFDTATLNLGVDADVTVDGASDAVVTINSDADITVTIEAASEYEELSVGGAGTVDLSFDAVGDVTTLTIDNPNGDVIVDAAFAAIDTTLVDAEAIRFTTAGAAAAATIATGQNLVFEADNGNDVTIRTDADLDSTSDSVTVTLETIQDDLIFDTANQEVENVTIIIDPNSDFDDTTNFTIDSLQGNSADEHVFTLTSDDADVEVVVTAFDAEQLDASGVAGDFTTTQTSDEDTTILGSSGTVDITFDGTTTDSTYIGKDGGGEINFVNTTGTASATFTGGDNTILANDLTSGDLAVISGDGDDVVEVDDLTSGGVSVTLGAGDDILRVGSGGNLAGAGIEADFGAGNDTLTMEDSTVDATELTLTFGAGSEDTLDLTSTNDVDLTAGTIEITGLEIIDYGTNITANVSDAVVDGLLLTGKTLRITGDADDGGDDIYSLLDVVIEANGTYDFSGISADRTLDAAVDGLNVTVDDTNNTIILTSARDVIDVGDGNVTVTGGDGADKITLGTGVNRVVIANGDSGTTIDADGVLDNEVDVIVSFDDAEDFLDMAVAASASNYTEIDGDLETSFADILSAAEDEMDGTVRYVYVYNADGAAGAETLAADGWDAGDGFLFADTDLDGDADMVIHLNGITGAGDFAFSNII